MNEEKYHYVYGILTGMSFLCSKSGMIRKTKIYDAWLTDFVWRMTLKLTEESRVMTMKNNANFEEELTCHFKIGMRNLTNFYWSTQKSKKFAL